MPEDFLRCVREGGKVWTKKLKGGRYRHFCRTKDGKLTKGEIKTKKKETK